MSNIQNMSKITQKKQQGTIILVTGAGGGIGQAICLALADKNTTILAVERTATRCSSLKKEIGKHGGVCEVYIADLSKHSNIQKLFKNIRKKYKTINWIVQSVGFLDKKESHKSLQQTFAINTFSLISFANLFTPHIKRGGFIHISSTAGIWGNPSFPIYSASKGAVNTFSQSLAKKIASKKLSCITLCPGPTNTKMLPRGIKTYQKPEAVANVIQKIVNKKSTYKNGDIIIVRDGKSKTYQRL